jgi:uncharacterized damage-inducible protein DinB
MDRDRQALTKSITRALSGKAAHLEPTRVFAELDWKAVGSRPGPAAHSVFQLLNHMAFWQEWVVSWLDGKTPPSTSGSWRGRDGPATRGEWEQAVARFQSGLEALARCAREGDLMSRRGKTSRLEMLQTATSHNSYHIGQVVVLRQLLGAWPPPSGRRRGRAA